MTSSPAHQSIIPDIAAHEAAEQGRMKRAETEYRQKESAIQKDQAAALKQAERDERAAASSELQAFSTNEIPRILQDGEADRKKAVHHLEAGAQSRTQPLLKSVVADALARFLRL